jgi:hypothetical protein
MSDAPRPAGDGPTFFPLSRVAVRDFGGALAPPSAAALIGVAQWMRAYLTNAHPEFDRLGDVCPFADKAARADVFRIAVSEARASDLLTIRRQMLDAFAAFDAIPYPRGMANFRSVIVAFPHCADAEGIAGLAAVRKSLRQLSFAKARMVGVFHQSAEAPCLWSAAFRPLRSPIPLMAIRALVENDAAFVMRHPLLAPAYLRSFPLAGGRRLIAELWRRA